MHVRQRRFLPNLSLLLAFDAVMRCGGVTAAAQDLALTQSTVTRLVQNLESQLGLALFERRRKRLHPTAAALRYHAEIAGALDRIQQASLALIANPAGGNLNLAVLPTFGTRWLAPRLPAFLAAHPGIAIQLSTRLARFDFAREAFDAMIYFGEGDWAGAGHLQLFAETLTACATPAYLQAQGINGPQDLGRGLLLSLASRPRAWDYWCTGQGVSLAAGQRSMWLDQFAMMIQAARGGIGIALLPDYLARLEIAEGHLLPLGVSGVSGPGAYWLAWPQDRAEPAALAAFRDWLAQAAGASH